MTIQVSKAKISDVSLLGRLIKMLQSLYIRNFVLIDQLELDFHPKMSVFTGETGAGKSILLGALSLALGARGEVGKLGPFATNCEIIAYFDIQNNKQAQNWTSHNEWPTENNELIIRRQINEQGRSKLWINGRPAPANQVQELGQSLIQIHGQHDQIKLLQTQTQRSIIDAHGQLTPQLEDTAQAYINYQALLKEQNVLQQTGALNEEQKQLLRYQCDELDQLALGIDEYEQLHQQLTTATYAQDLILNIEQGLNNLQDGEHNALNFLAKTHNQLKEAQGMDFATIVAMLDESMINVTEAYNELKNQQQQIDNDPELLHEIEQRLDLINTIARRQKVMPELLYGHHQQLLEQLQQSVDLAQKQARLENDLSLSLQIYQQKAQLLSQARTQAANTLSQQITEMIQQLGLPEARFRIDVSYEKDKSAKKDGNDRVEFMVAINKGQTFQPLSKTASGGELSRISLAIEVCCQRQNNNSQSFIFDEIDTGIGGATAEKVGAIMQQLSRDNQVFAVTHLPQVAGHAHDHLLISKSSVGEHTTSKVTHLNKQQRIEELARMTGGETITKATLAQAKEFLKL